MRVVGRKPNEIYRLSGRIQEILHLIGCGLRAAIELNTIGKIYHYQIRYTPR